MSMMEIFPLGQKVELGSRTFDEAAILAFAHKFDPQPFHTEKHAAKDYVFGALCASGWHTASGWMRAFLDLWADIVKTRQAEGKPLPVLGPSPGFKELKWFKPVFVGDVITYYMTPNGSRPLNSRPGWHLNTSLAEGVNQNGETILQFQSSVLEFR